MTFCRDSSYAPVVPIPGPGDLLTFTHVFAISQLVYCNPTSLTTWEYWRILRSINGFKMHMHNFECCKTCQCSTVRCIAFLYATRMQLKGLVITLKNLHGMGPGFMWDYLSPRVSAHSTKSDRFSMLQVSSFKQCHLAGLRWYAFSNIAFFLWNNLAPQIQKAPSRRPLIPQVLGPGY